MKYFKPEQDVTEFLLLINVPIYVHRRMLVFLLVSLFVPPSTDADEARKGRAAHASHDSPAISGALTSKTWLCEGSHHSHSDFIQSLYCAFPYTGKSIRRRVRSTVQCIQDDRNTGKTRCTCKYNLPGLVCNSISNSSTAAQS